MSSLNGTNGYHDFNDRSDLAHRFDPDWERLIRRQVLLDAIAFRWIGDQSMSQRLGDLRVKLQRGDLIFVELKTRDPERAFRQDGTPYRDMLAEDVSQFYGDGHPYNKPGWACDPNKKADLLLYGLPHLRVAFLLPFPEFQRAYAIHAPRWKLGRAVTGGPAHPLISDNRDYHTINVAISWRSLRETVPGARLLHFPVKLEHDARQLSALEHALRLLYEEDAVLPIDYLARLDA